MSSIHEYLQGTVNRKLLYATHQAEESPPRRSIHSYTSRIMRVETVDFVGLGSSECFTYFDVAEMCQCSFGSITSKLGML